MKKTLYKNYKFVLAHIFYIFILLLIYIFQTSLKIFDNSNVIPLIIIPLTLSIVIYQDFIITCIYSLFAGILCDIAFNIYSGLSCFIFFIINLFIFILITYYFRNNLASFLFLNIIFISIDNLLMFIFKYGAINLCWKLYCSQNAVIILVTEFISIPIFFFFSYIDRRFLSNQDIFYMKENNKNRFNFNE